MTDRDPDNFRAIIPEVGLIMAQLFGAFTERWFAQMRAEAKQLTKRAPSEPMPEADAAVYCVGFDQDLYLETPAIANSVAAWYAALESGRKQEAFRVALRMRHNGLVHLGLTDTPHPMVRYLLARLQSLNRIPRLHPDAVAHIQRVETEALKSGGPAGGVVILPIKEKPADPLTPWRIIDPARAEKAHLN